MLTASAPRWSPVRPPSVECAWFVLGVYHLSESSFISRKQVSTQIEVAALFFAWNSLFDGDFLAGIESLTEDHCAVGAVAEC